MFGSYLTASKLFLLFIFGYTKSCIAAVGLFILIFILFLSNVLLFGSDFFVFLLLLIYISAIMVLFLFVLMTTELDKSWTKEPLIYEASGNLVFRFSFIKPFTWTAAINKIIRVANKAHIIYGALFVLMLTNMFVFGASGLSVLFLFNVGFFAYGEFSSLGYLNAKNWFYGKFIEDSYVQNGELFAESLKHFYYDNFLNTLSLIQWANIFFVDYWVILYLCAFLLFLVTVGVIVLILPGNRNLI